MATMLYLCIFCVFSVALGIDLDVSDLRYVGTWWSHRADPTHPENFEDVFPDLRWTVPPIPDQLNRGIWAYRFHLWTRADEIVFIATLPPGDEQTRCDTVVECIEPLVDFMKANPTAPPMYIMLHWDWFVGTEFIRPEGDVQLGVLNSLIDTYGMDTFYTVGDYLGDEYDSVRGAFEGKGYPTLAETRGKMFLLTDSVLAFNDTIAEEAGEPLVFDPVKPYWYTNCADCDTVQEVTKASALERTIFQYFFARGVEANTVDNHDTLNLCATIVQGPYRADLEPEALNTTERIRLLFIFVDRDLNGEISEEEVGTLQLNLAQRGPTVRQQLYDGCRADDDVITLQELEACIAGFAALGLDLTEGVPTPRVADAIKVVMAAARQACHVTFTNFPILVPGERQDYLITSPSPACGPHIPVIDCMQELRTQNTGGGSGSGTTFTVNFNNHGGACRNNN